VRDQAILCLLVEDKRRGLRERSDSILIPFGGNNALKLPDGEPAGSHLVVLPSVHRAQGYTQAVGELLLRQAHGNAEFPDLISVHQHSPLSHNPFSEKFHLAYYK
jgi:hypothetical protein